MFAKLKLFVVSGGLFVAGLSASANAQSFGGWLNDVDYDLLVSPSEYGTSLANGSNVPVTIVESDDGNIANVPTTDRQYYPNTADSRFAGKTMTPRVGSWPNPSNHATLVGAYFFGKNAFSQRSLAPEIGNIDMYSFSWESSFFLNPGSPPPLISPNLSRVASFAYGATSSLSTLKRMDFVVENDEFIQVVGSQAVSNHAHAFNSIAVAQPTGITTTGTNNLGAPYVAGRFRPDVSGPVGTTSDSTGAVGGLAALLISRGKAEASLSDHTISTRPGYTVRSAETSEVVKAAIMAGALRATSGHLFGNISDYRVSASNQTVNGLDKRFGAGKVNAYQSYKIIDAGEQGSQEDGGAGIGAYGFDYDPAFGGLSSSNDLATYGFTATQNTKFHATLAWNIKINDPIPPSFPEFPPTFDSTATLYDMNLRLIDLTAGGTEVAASLSTIDNTETIWTDVTAGHLYKLVVTPGSSQGDFLWDYGLAWRGTGLTATAVPEPTTLGMLLVSGLGLLRRRSR